MMAPKLWRKLENYFVMFSLDNSCLSRGLLILAACKVSLNQQEGVVG